MQTCRLCRWRYPDDLLFPVLLSGVEATNICGLCATHWLRDPIYSSVNAEEMRDKAAAYRANNPAGAPTIVDEPRRYLPRPSQKRRRR